ncbi:ClpP/crotonase-like domain-containing protein [Lophiotrema nucula]|uniref:ClpP/crotonase-like domain-containing protein n=1 Tax=Lophiotrema nucula TaxID=690887 RepID=A0A6A5ZPY0_9PLEO|nr:ClpP/crotonase-like domain-containing protein [Lophiotrema nucula]
MKFILKATRSLSSNHPRRGPCSSPGVARYLGLPNQASRPAPRLTPTSPLIPPRHHPRPQLSSYNNVRMSSTSSDPEPDAVLHKTLPSGITTITLNRAARRNAVDPSTAQKLYNAFLAYEADDTQKVCVFHGNNGIFCAGYDLHTAAQSSLSDASSAHFGSVDVGGRNIGPMGPSRLQIKKPVICAVSGYAVAGGLELSLLGDMRVVEEDAVFGVFCRRWGIPLIDGGTVRLPAIVGLGRAMDMILTGRPVGAPEALQMGLANRVVPKGKGLEEALKIAEDLVKFPQLCVRADRDSCYNAVYNAKSFEEALKFEFDNAHEVLAKETVEGAKKFSGGAGRGGSFKL